MHIEVKVYHRAVGLCAVRNDGRLGILNLYVLTVFIFVAPDKLVAKQMLLLGIEYAKDKLGATRADLGVFDNNPKARSCYEAVGFREYGAHMIDTPFGPWHCTDMEISIG